MAVNRLNVGATNQLLAKASTGQSTNILELQNTAGVTVAGVDASGNPVGGLAAPTAAGKNKIINGDFGVWQRGTSFTPTSGSYTSDRWQVVFDGTGATRTISQQTFTPGAAPVAGYEGTFFYRYAQSVAGSGATYSGFQQRIEDVRTFAGQTVIVSFWAKANASQTLTIDLTQNFGSGGSASVGIDEFITISTSWTRYSYVFNLASISGKTIGAGSFLQMYFGLPINTTFTVDIWGVQVEAGSIATPFVPAGGGSQQAELALCQRYYQKSYNQGTNPGTAANYAGAVVWSSVTTGAYGSGIPVCLKTTMRATPTVTIYNPETGATGSIRGISAGNNFAGIADYIGDNTFTIYATATQSSAGFLIGTHYVAQIEL